MRSVPGRLSRRSLLAVTAAGAMSLAACGGSTQQHEPDPNSAHGGPEQGERTPMPGVGGPGLVAEVSDIPVGAGKVYPYKQLVVTHPAANMFRGFRAVCTYQPCALSAVQDGLIVCPCHGCRYAIADGSVRNGPATRPLPALTISVNGGEIYLLD